MQGDRERKTGRQCIGDGVSGWEKQELRGHRSLRSKTEAHERIRTTPWTQMALHSRRATHLLGCLPHQQNFIVPVKKKKATHTSTNSTRAVLRCVKVPYSTLTRFSGICRYSMLVGSKFHRKEVWCSHRPFVMACALPPNWCARACKADGRTRAATTSTVPAIRERQFSQNLPSKPLGNWVIRARAV